MKIVADKSRCAGHARCAAVAGQLFELNGDGYIAFDEKAVPPELTEAARRGVRACPERALRISEDGGVPR
jgi:ferredoxin